MELTANELKKLLWETLQDVKKGDIQPMVSNAVATQSREIVRVVKAQLMIAEKTNRNISTELLDFSEK